MWCTGVDQRHRGETEREPLLRVLLRARASICIHASQNTGASSLWALLTAALGWYWLSRWHWQHTEGPRGEAACPSHRHPEWRSQSPPSPSDPPPAPFPLLSCVSAGDGRFIHLPKALPLSIHFLLPQQRERKKSPATPPILRSITNSSA